MGLNPPVPVLRTLFQKRNNVAKVSLVVPAGDELVVSEGVAEQLLATGDFVETSVLEGEVVPARRGSTDDAAPGADAPKKSRKA